MTTAITNCRIYTGTEILDHQAIIVRDGIVIGVEKDVPADAVLIDAGGDNIAPGLIDIQVNGGKKLYFSQFPNEETLHDICDSSLQFGATHVLPCLISSPHDKILEAIDVVKNFKQKHDKGVLGMHLEGPFINPAKRGAHNAAVIRKPTYTELEEIIRHGKDVIKLITIAPEQFTDEQLDLLLQSNIIVSAGHSMMNYETARHYFNKGIRLVTHLFNAMTQMGHREPGMVGAVLDNDEVYAPIILDGAHCHYAAARIAYRVKKEKLFLISDAAFLGRQVKSFSSDLLDATLVENFYRNAEGNLAGAAISMAEAVQNAFQHLNISLEAAVEMATVNVASALGLQHQLGKIATGYPARFITFNNDFSAYNTLVP